MSKRLNTYRQTRKYSNEEYTKVLDWFKKHTSRNNCVFTLDEFITKSNNEKLKELFITDSNRFINKFMYYFKGIDDCPMKWRSQVFDGFITPGACHFGDWGYDSNFYRNSVFFAIKINYMDYVRLVNIVITAVMRELRHKCGLDGYTPNYNKNV